MSVIGCLVHLHSMVVLPLSRLMLTSKPNASTIDAKVQARIDAEAQTMSLPCSAYSACPSSLKESLLSLSVNVTLSIGLCRVGGLCHSLSCFLGVGCFLTFVASESLGLINLLSRGHTATTRCNRCATHNA